jgi:hypothetical protein
MNYILISYIIVVLYLLFVKLSYIENKGLYLYSNYIRFSLFYINKYKSIIVILLIYLNFFLSKQFYKNKNKKVAILIIISILVLFLYTLYYLPQHCQHNLCKLFYTKPSEIGNFKNLENERFISFFGCGDIQFFMNKNFKIRAEKTKQLVKAMNIINEKIKNNDYSNINFSDDFTKKILFIGNKNLIGLLNPGDNTQIGEDGRLFSSNIIGLYEYYFNNNPEDGGLLDIPVYDILGNHDYDSHEKTEPSHKIYYGIPSLDMIKRRILYKKYVVNKDNYGNYSCNFGKLHIIFINIWPKNAKLLSGIPYNTINFLNDDLKKFGKMKWMILTHGEIVKFSDETLKLILDNDYHKNYLLYIHGHIHLRNLYFNKNDNIINLACPASDTIYYRSFANIIYDQEKEIVYLINIKWHFFDNKIKYFNVKLISEIKINPNSSIFK